MVHYLWDNVVVKLVESPLALPEKALPHYIPQICKYAVIVLAVALLVYGFISGGTADVLTKAKNICTECVGLG